MPSRRAPCSPLARRRFLPAAFLVVLSLACASTRAGGGGATPPGPATLVYVGGYRPEIQSFRMDPDTGKLTPAGAVAAGKAPSFLAVDPSAHTLVAADEVDAGQVLSFRIDQGTGALTPVNSAGSAGVGPAHLSIDHTGRWVLVANYAGGKPGTVAVLPLSEDGRLGTAVDTRDFGPGTMPHMITVDPGNHNVFVPCKGGPFVVRMGFDPGTGKFAAGEPERHRGPDGSGPRHLAFAPSGKLAYLISEMAMTISAFDYDGASGLLTGKQSIPTLPPDAPRAGATTADIHVHPSGKFLYGFNRGHDSIVIYKLDDAGKMTVVGWERRTIKRPRNFHIDPTGRWLLVANQDADNVSVFRIDQATGTLEPVGAPVSAGAKPSYVGVVTLPGK